MFAIIFICILREGIWKNRKKLEPAKISCHTVFSTFYKNFLPLAFFNQPRPRAFPLKNGWGHFLREKPWGGDEVVF